MQKVIITRGLPASGKSTWAKNLVLKDSTYKRINKDDLRAMLDASKWTPKNEEFILKLRNELILQLLLNGFSVIVDDTNLKQKHISTITELVNHYNSEYRSDLPDEQIIVEINDSFLNVSVHECISRDAERTVGHVGEDVIRSMYETAIKDGVIKREVEAFRPRAVIFDIDGTLALMNGRNPFEFHKVGTDLVNEYVRNVLWMYQDNGYKIIILSGREETCRKETEKWLSDSNINDYEHLIMRKKGDSRKDDIIKEEIYRNLVEPFYVVEAVVDDRLSVCRMWTKIGLNLFRVGDPDAVF